jgi:hypothetical protein
LASRVPRRLRKSASASAPGCWRRKASRSVSQRASASRALPPVDLGLGQIEPAGGPVAGPLGRAGVQAGELGEPQPRGVEQLEQGLVAQRLEALGAAGQQGLGLVGRERARQPPRSPGRAQTAGRVGGQVTLQHLLVEKAAPA